MAKLQRVKQNSKSNFMPENFYEFLTNRCEKKIKKLLNLKRLETSQRKFNFYEKIFVFPAAVRSY
ncbi:MAG: hypothetical protein ACR2FN_12075 [Chitinophagaceae bacterium]